MYHLQQIVCVLPRVKNKTIWTSGWMDGLGDEMEEMMEIMEMREIMGGYPERPSLWIITIVSIMNIMRIIMSTRSPLCVY